MNYITPYYCVATSGETRDGRVLRPEWLLSMAETYDPDEAEALLWWNHSRWYNPGGSVASVKAEKTDDGRVKLYARIRPTGELMYEAQHTEVPYKFSVEIRPMGDDSYYLDGLAYTHDPASVAVDKLEFSKQRPELLLGQLEEVEKLEFSAQGLLASLFGRTPPQPKTELPSKTFTKDQSKPEQDDDVMTPEQFAVLQGISSKLDTFQKDMDEMKAKLETFGKQAEKLDKLDTFQSDLEGMKTKLEEAHTVVHEIGEFSAGRFKRRPATGEDADRPDIDY